MSADRFRLLLMILIVLTLTGVAWMCRYHVAYKLTPAVSLVLDRWTGNTIAVRRTLTAAQREADALRFKCEALEAQYLVAHPAGSSATMVEQFDAQDAAAHWADAQMVASASRDRTACTFQPRRS